MVNFKFFEFGKACLKASRSKFAKPLEAQGTLLIALSEMKYREFSLTPTYYTRR